MDAHELLDPQELVGLALSELKSAAVEAPPARRQAIEQKIERAEEMLAIARSKSAKELGFHIHDCKFPPPLMFWDKSRQGRVCENCGHLHRSAGVRVRQETSWVRARRLGGSGGNDDGTGWMG